MPEFILDAFSSEVQMSTSGALDSAAVPTVTADATAVLTVNVDHMKQVFKFQTDSADFLNDNASDVKYYVNMANWPTLNPANSMMNHAASASPIASGYASNKMMVAHDYTRYLAQELFGTHHGVDLFNNEVQLLQNLRLICGSGEVGRTWEDILTKMNAVSTTGTAAFIVTDAAGNYTTNSSSSNDNICRVLFRQMASTASERFSAISNSADAQSLPFQVDDVISFKVIINPAANQHNLTGVPAISARSYKIKLVMKAAGDVSNTAVDAAEL